MSKIIPCPVKHFAGTITLPDFVNYEVLAEWQRAARLSMSLFEDSAPDENGNTHLVVKKTSVDADFRALRIPPILLWVEAWDLQNMPAKPNMRTFPATPKRAAGALYDWLVKLISDEIDAEDADIPNA